MQQRARAAELGRAHSQRRRAIPLGKLRPGRVESARGLSRGICNKKLAAQYHLRTGNDWEKHGNGRSRRGMTAQIGNEIARMLCGVLLALYG